MTTTPTTDGLAEVTAGLLDDAALLLDDIVELRRRIHAHPELGLDVPVTQQTILEALDGLSLEMSTGSATTSVVAVLDGEEAGPTTLLRADMDALAMPEDTGLPYASRIDGRMHACGHDAHVAMLVGAAKLLAARRSSLAGRVVFMFQPGEEGAGGAEVMIGEGLLDRYGRVDRAFAIHVTPMFDAGVVAIRPGTMLASADEFAFTITGKGGHASMPYLAVDPVPVACEIVTALQAMVTRRVPAFDPGVLTVSMIHAGTAHNVIPETVHCEGTIRAVSDASRDLLVANLRQVVANVAAAHGCSAEVDLEGTSYPVTINDHEVAALCAALGEQLAGADRLVRMPAPVMGAEDWSYVLQRVPGAMAFLGVAVPGDEHPAPNHSNRMLVHEPAMATGVALHAAMALC